MSTHNFRCNGEMSKIVFKLSSNEPRCEKTGLQGFPTMSDTNRSVQSQKMARGLKFRI